MKNLFKFLSKRAGIQPPRVALIPAFALVAFVLSASSTIAAPVTGPVATFPGQPNARITAVVDKPVFYLGENVMIRLHIMNVSDEPFDADTGGDGEEMEREARFHITAVDQNGVATTDPLPNYDSTGGLYGPTTVTKEKDAWFATPLMSYCRVDHPGTYTITISHDLGWTTGPKPDQYPPDMHTHAGLPTATIIVRFVMPTIGQARRVIAEQEASPGGETLSGEPPPTDRDWSGKPGDDEERDFSQMRFPVYLPFLAARASRDSGNSFADDVAGIGAMPTPEATAELIELMGRSNADCAWKAADMLGHRILDPYLEDATTKDAGLWANNEALASEYLWNRSWRPDLKPAARRAAARFFDGSTRDITAAAHIFAGIGQASDMPLIVDVLDRELGRNEVTSLTSPDSDYHSTVEDLMDAARFIQDRSGTSLTNPKTQAEMLIWSAQTFAKPVAQWPDGWQDVSNRIYVTQNHALRALALQNMYLKAKEPQVASELIPFLPGLLLDDDYYVRAYAIYAAYDVKDPSLNPTMLSMLKTSGMSDTMFLTDDLWENGGAWDALDILIDKPARNVPVDDNSPEQKREAYSYDVWNAERALSKLIDVDHAYNGGQIKPADLPAYQAKWRAFIVAHKADIEAGKRWSADDPEITALFPADFK